MTEALSLHGLERVHRLGGYPWNIQTCRKMIQYTWDVNRTNHQLQLIGHDCEYHYDEADVETISYLLKISPQKKKTRINSH